MPVISIHESSCRHMDPHRELNRISQITPVYHPSDYRHVTQVLSPLRTPQHTKLLSESAHTILKLPTSSPRWARAQLRTQALPSWFPSQGASVCIDSTFCGESEGGPGSGCPWKGRSCVALTGGTIFRGATLSLPGQARGIPEAKTGTAGEGWDP